MGLISRVSSRTYRLKMPDASRRRSRTRSRENKKKNSSFDGYDYYMSNEWEDQGNELSGRNNVSTADEIIACLPGGHKIDDLLDEVDRESNPDTDTREFLKNLSNTLDNDDIHSELSDITEEFKSTFKNSKFGLKEDPFFDNEADEEDEKFAKSKNYQKADKSDAIISCPNCFTVLCVDCQQHTKYKDQYRAMFVRESVKIIPDKIVKFRKLDNFGRKRKKGKEDHKLPENEVFDFYKQAVCENCKNEVAVQDSEEIFHFYNCIAS